MAANRFLPLPVTIPHALAVATLPDHHRDPFDRLLIAQARHEGFKLVSRDPHIRTLRRAPHRGIRRSTSLFDASRSTNKHVPSFQALRLRRPGASPARSTRASRGQVLSCSP